MSLRFYIALSALLLGISIAMFVLGSLLIHVVVVAQLGVNVIAVGAIIDQNRGIQRTLHAQQNLMLAWMTANGVTIETTDETKTQS